MSKNIYLDYASATPISEAVLKAMLPYFAENFYNPSAIYSKAKDVKSDILKAKQIIAGVLGVMPAEIIFTSGGSEANNLAIKGVMDKFPEKLVLVSSIEHDSVIAPANEYKNKQLSVGKDGILSVEKLEITDEVVLVSVMLANNEIGTIQPIKKVADKIQGIRKDRLKRKLNLPIYFHVDACQAPLYLDLHAHRLGADLMTINSGKIYGPKQTGALFVGGNVRLKPQILGGGQQRKIRSGTESAANIIGFAKALELATKHRLSEVKRIQGLQQRFIKGIIDIDQNIFINGSLKKRLPSNVHATFPGRDNERLLFELDELGIYAAAGSACSASSEEPSHVLKAIGLDDQAARSSIRFSMGVHTDKKAVDYTLKMLHKLLV